MLKRLTLSLCGWLLLMPASAETDVLSLPEALQRLQARHPALQVCAREAEIARATRQQEARPSQPVLELAGEDFGPAAVSNQNYQQWTLSLNQSLNLNQRPELLRQRGELEARSAEADCRRQARELSLQLVKRYFEGLYWQEREVLAQSQVRDAEAVVGLIDRQIAAGKLSLLERTPALQERARRRLEQTLAASQLQAGLRRLDEFWPGQPLAATRLAWPAPREADSENPQLQQQQLQETLAALEIRQLQAEVLPPLRIGSGLRWHPQSGELGINLQLGWDLPVWHQQQDALRAASLRQEQQQWLRRQLEAGQAGQRAQLCLQSRALGQQLQAYEQELLPAASDYRARIQRGLEAGKFGTLVLLQARQQLTELQQMHLQLRIDAAATAYEVASLGGCP